MPRNMPSTKKQTTIPTAMRVDVTGSQLATGGSPCSDAVQLHTADNVRHIVIRPLLSTSHLSIDLHSESSQDLLCDEEQAAQQSTPINVDVDLNSPREHDRRQLTQNDISIGWESVGIPSAPLKRPLAVSPIHVKQPRRQSMVTSPRAKSARKGGVSKRSPRLKKGPSPVKPSPTPEPDRSTQNEAQSTSAMHTPPTSKRGPRAKENKTLKTPATKSPNKLSQPLPVQAETPSIASPLPVSPVVSSLNDTTILSPPKKRRRTKPLKRLNNQSEPTAMTAVSPRRTRRLVIGNNQLIGLAMGTRCNLPHWGLLSLPRLN